MVLFTKDKATENDIIKMQKILQKCKIDHSYDDKVESIPPDCGFWDSSNYFLQEIARDCFDTLKALNRLPDNIPWIQEELKRENENHT